MLVFFISLATSSPAKGFSFGSASPNVRGGKNIFSSNSPQGLFCLKNNETIGKRLLVIDRKQINIRETIRKKNNRHKTIEQYAIKKYNNTKNQPNRKTRTTNMPGKYIKNNRVRNETQAKKIQLYIL